MKYFSGQPSPSAQASAKKSYFVAGCCPPCTAHYLEGAPLLLLAALLFGLAHSYQGISGMLLTALAGALFCGLYVATGSLLLPILLHILIDVRFAVLPAPRAQEPRTILA